MLDKNEVINNIKSHSKEINNLMYDIKCKIKTQDEINMFYEFTSTLNTGMRVKLQDVHGNFQSLARTDLAKSCVIHVIGSHDLGYINKFYNDIMMTLSKLT